MAWSHPEISLENLMDRIKGFVDILVLASGYQSSGLPAVWNVDNVKKAVKWGFFFQNVLKSLRLCANYEESLKEFDAALFNLTSDPIFPLGLAHMSCETLYNARRIVLENLLQTHPIMDGNLAAILRAVVEMDIDELAEARNDCLVVYIERLRSKMDLMELGAGGMGLTEMNKNKTLLLKNDPSTSKSLKKIDQNHMTHFMIEDETSACIGADASFSVIQIILNRQAVMSCLFSVEKGLDGLSKIITGNAVGSENISDDQILLELNQFSQWRSMCLSYFLDKRTIKLLSGAGLIFQAPKEQWILVFEGLMSSTDPCYDNVLEIMEILLLELISSKWNHLFQVLMSLSCDFLSIPEKLSDIHEVLHNNTLVLHSNKENDILDYLLSLLRSHPHKLWKLPSVLVAAAIPSWSDLFRTHLSDVENHYNESYSATRCHGYDQHGSKHEDCQITDRIQSFHAFHIRGSEG